MWFTKADCNCQRVLNRSPGQAAPSTMRNSCVKATFSLRRYHAATASLIACSLWLPLPAHSMQSGERTYRDVCQSCHATGLAGSPKYGDEASWGALIEEGQAVLTAHGWVGVRAMPPKGGKPDLSLEAFAQAVAYMARSGGADWANPDAAMLEQIQLEITKRRAELDAKTTAEQ
jgi:cytochrome c5